ncbi:hypothetical protein [Acanthopleuribacter pedis]|uniref:Uncharacterized protein n=1 Tax=Acanthopleuribacter pedis TaxID=442870 RepID=A0A8J7U693_9BACT|nr:hypothetical protein [Acanthopleuribacter pedis]MBO1321223.1 hypothetical protein [Acanthopleuribacter pedis]
MKEKTLVFMVLSMGIAWGVFFGGRYWAFHSRQNPIRDAALVGPRAAGDRLMLELTEFVERKSRGLPSAHREVFRDDPESVSGYLEFFETFERRFGARLAEVTVEARVTRQPGLLAEYEMEAPYGHFLEELGLVVLYLAHQATLHDQPDLRVRCLNAAEDLMRLTLSWPGLDLLSGTWFWRTKYYEFRVFYAREGDPDGKLPSPKQLRALFEGAVFLHCATLEQRLLEEHHVWPPRLFTDEPSIGEMLFDLRSLYGDLQFDHPDRPFSARYPLAPKWQIRTRHRPGDVRYLAVRFENLAAYIGLETSLLDAARLYRNLGPEPDPATVRAAINRLQLRNPFDGDLYRVDARGRLVVLPPRSPLVRVLGARGDLAEAWYRWVAVPNG